MKNKMNEIEKFKLEQKKNIEKQAKDESLLMVSDSFFYKSFLVALNNELSYVLR